MVAAVTLVNLPLPSPKVWGTLHCHFYIGVPFQILTSVLLAIMNVLRKVISVQIPQDHTYAPVSLDISGMALHAKVC